MNVIFFVSFIILSIGQAFAVNNVYVQEYGNMGFAIVADSNEWSCIVNKKVISGRHKKEPVSFTFSLKAIGNPPEKFTDKTIMPFIENYLTRYASEHNSIFSSIFLREHNNTYYIIEGYYFDSDLYNNKHHHSGGFSIYVKPINTEHNWCCFMQVFIDEELLLEPIGDSERHELYQKAFDLITPLYSQK